MLQESSVFLVVPFIGKPYFCYLIPEKRIISGLLIVSVQFFLFLLMK